ncbi:MAG: hypothetical protein PVI01_18100 [Gemmatimonadales bacterium]|jgi:GGDEF domain-containing protein
MDKGKVHEERSLDAGRGTGGPPLAFGVSQGRRRGDGGLEARPSEPREQPAFRESESGLLREGADWVWWKEGLERVRTPGLLDPQTGQHTALGIDRRLKELVALSQRNDEPLACVVFGADPIAEDQEVTAEAMLIVAERFGESLQRQTRRTDVIGRLEPLKYIVLAPRTPPFGGLRLAERFTSLSLSWFLAGESPVTFSAGVAGVEGRGGDLEVRPGVLVEVARQALTDARMAGAAQIAAAWLDV